MRSPILYTFTPCWCRSLGLTPPDGHIREYIPICRGVPLVAQMVKNLPAMQKTQVKPLGQEDPLDKGMQPTPVSLPAESHGQRSLVGYSSGVAKSRTRLSD